MDTPLQIHLPLSVGSEAVFANYYIEPGSVRDTLCDTLQAGLAARQAWQVYIWGPAVSGRSHLLLACCQYLRASVEASSSERPKVCYLPLAELLDFDPRKVLEDLGDSDLVCIDGLQALAGRTDWELALFDFYNGLSAHSGLLVAADGPPAAVGLGLADLRSRFSAGAVFHLPRYDDEQTRAIVKFRARYLGINLGDEALSFLFNRAPRDLHSLMALLRELDTYSLVRKRPVTIATIKAAFGW